jgi:hypothetical protein
MHMKIKFFKCNGAKRCLFMGRLSYAKNDPRSDRMPPLRPVVNGSYYITLFSSFEGVYRVGIVDGFGIRFFPVTDSKN